MEPLKLQNYEILFELGYPDRFSSFCQHAGITSVEGKRRGATTGRDKEEQSELSCDVKTPPPPRTCGPEPDMLQSEQIRNRDTTI